jgi:carbonic anhydrase
MSISKRLAVKTRRDLLKMNAAAAGTALLARAGIRDADPPRNPPQAQWSPERALEELLAGNKRFTESSMTAFEDDLKILKQKTVDRQEPFAAVLSCSDSRVPVEIIFDQSIGHIFVTRVAGNILSPEVIASLEFGAAVLGIKAIMVMGHANCGAVKAAMAGKSAPGQITALYRHFQPAIAQSGDNLEAAIKANARIQCSLLGKSSTVVSAMLKEHKLLLVPAYYDLAVGTVTLLD